MTPTLTTLLCLGEMKTGGKPWSERDSAPQPGPGKSGPPGLRKLMGRRDQLRTQGLSLTGTLFQGGVWTHEPVCRQVSLSPGFPGPMSSWRIRATARQLEMENSRSDG